MLYRVCKALGTYFVSVGYCQGLNFLVGFMLQLSGGREVEVLNLVAALMTSSRFQFLGLYDREFPLVNFLKYVFHSELAIRDKKLGKAIEDSMLPDDVWLTKWFISVFTGYIPRIYATRALDFILSLDVSGIVSYSLALVVSLRKKIVGGDLESINNTVNGLMGEDSGLPSPHKVS